MPLEILKSSNDIQQISTEDLQKLAQKIEADRSALDQLSEVEKKNLVDGCLIALKEEIANRASVRTAEQQKRVDIMKTILAAHREHEAGQETTLESTKRIATDAIDTVKRNPIRSIGIGVAVVGAAYYGKKILGGIYNLFKKAKDYAGRKLRTAGLVLQIGGIAAAIATLVIGPTKVFAKLRSTFNKSKMATEFAEGTKEAANKFVDDGRKKVAGVANSIANAVDPKEKSSKFKNEVAKAKEQLHADTNVPGDQLLKKKNQEQEKVSSILEKGTEIATTEMAISALPLQYDIAAQIDPENDSPTQYLQDASEILKLAQRNNIKMDLVMQTIDAGFQDDQAYDIFLREIYPNRISFTDQERNAAKLIVGFIEKNMTLLEKTAQTVNKPLETMTLVEAMNIFSQLQDASQRIGNELSKGIRNAILKQEIPNPLPIIRDVFSNPNLISKHIIDATLGPLSLYEPQNEDQQKQFAQEALRVSAFFLSGTHIRCKSIDASMPEAWDTEGNEQHMTQELLRNVQSESMIRALEKAAFVTSSENEDGEVSQAIREIVLQGKLNLKDAFQLYMLQQNSDVSGTLLTYKVIEILESFREYRHLSINRYNVIITKIQEALEESGSIDELAEQLQLSPGQQTELENTYKYLQEKTRDEAHFLWTWTTQFASNHPKIATAIGLTIGIPTVRTAHAYTTKPIGTFLAKRTYNRIVKFSQMPIKAPGQTGRFTNPYRSAEDFAKRYNVKLSDVKDAIEDARRLVEQHTTASDSKLFPRWKKWGIRREGSKLIKKTKKGKYSSSQNTAVQEATESATKATAETAPSTQVASEVTESTGKAVSETIEATEKAASSSNGWKAFNEAAEEANDVAKKALRNTSPNDLLRKVIEERPEFGRRFLSKLDGCSGIEEAEAIIKRTNEAAARQGATIEDIRNAYKGEDMISGMSRAGRSARAAEAATSAANPSKVPGHNRLKPSRMNSTPPQPAVARANTALGESFEQSAAGQSAARDFDEAIQALDSDATRPSSRGASRAGSASPTSPTSHSTPPATARAVPDIATPSILDDVTKIDDAVDRSVAIRNILQNGEVADEFVDAVRVAENAELMKEVQLVAEAAESGTVKNTVLAKIAGLNADEALQSSNRVSSAVSTVADVAEEGAEAAAKTSRAWKLAGYGLGTVGIAADAAAIVHNSIDIYEARQNGDTDIAAVLEARNRGLAGGGSVGLLMYGMSGPQIILFLPIYLGTAFATEAMYESTLELYKDVKNYAKLDDVTLMEKILNQKLGIASWALGTILSSAEEANRPQREKMYRGLFLKKWAKLLTATDGEAIKRKVETRVSKMEEEPDEYRMRELWRNATVAQIKDRIRDRMTYIDNVTAGSYEHLPPQKLKNADAYAELYAMREELEARGEEPIITYITPSGDTKTLDIGNIAYTGRISDPKLLAQIEVTIRTYREEIQPLDIHTNMRTDMQIAALEKPEVLPEIQKDAAEKLLGSLRYSIAEAEKTIRTKFISFPVQRNAVRYILRKNIEEFVDTALAGWQDGSLQLEEFNEHMAQIEDQLADVESVYALQSTPIHVALKSKNGGGHLGRNNKKRRIQNAKKEMDAELGMPLESALTSLLA